MPSRIPTQVMIDPTPPGNRQSRSLTSPGENKREHLHSMSQTSQSSMSPAQLSRKAESPAMRRNSSPASNTGSGNR